MKFVSLVLVMVLFSACGYSPSAKFSREVVGEKISTSVHISSSDPENTVIVKDAVDAAIIKVFHASLTTKAFAQTHLALTLSNPSYSPVQYDADGFVTAYRTHISLSIKRTTGESTKSYTAKGTYDFGITPAAVISDRQRYEAIQFSAEKAIRSFVAQVSSEGTRPKEEEKETEVKKED